MMYARQHIFNWSLVFLLLAAILIAQWIDPVSNISEDNINNELDNIASEVRYSLQILCVY